MNLTLPSSWTRRGHLLSSASAVLSFCRRSLACFTKMSIYSEAGSYWRPINPCINHLKARGPSRTWTGSEEEEEEKEPRVTGLILFIQGYLAHKKQRPPRTLQQEYAQGPMVVLRGGAVSYQRGTPVTITCQPCMV